MRYTRMLVCGAIISAAVLALGVAAPAATTTTTAAPTTIDPPSTTTTTTGAVHAASASLAASPNTGLHDLQTITVTGAGLPANQTVDVSQCQLHNGQSGGVCYDATRTRPTTDAGGAFTSSFIVRRVITESTSSVDCATVTCGVEVAFVPPGQTAGVAFADLSFDASVPANSPHVNAQPSSDLHDGASVTLQGTGFTPAADVVIAQCASDSIGLSRCDTSNEAHATADAQGAFPATTFVVHESIVISGSQGGPVDCTTAPCAIVAANAAGASEYASAFVAFATTTSNTTTVTAAALPNTGSSSAPLTAGAVGLIAAGLALVAGAGLGAWRRRARA